MLDAPAIVVAAREHSGLTKAEFARVIGTSRGALDQIEKGQRSPRTETLARMMAAAGVEATVTLSHLSAPDATHSLAEWCATIDVTDADWTWRWLVSDFVANEFVPATRVVRSQALRDEPHLTGDGRWDTFVASLAEHLAFHAEVPVPSWTSDPARHAVTAFWWPVHGSLPSPRAAALTWSPASFKRRRILIDGREIPAVYR